MQRSQGLNIIDVLIVQALARFFDDQDVKVGFVPQPPDKLAVLFGHGAEPQGAVKRRRSAGSAMGER